LHALERHVFHGCGPSVEKAAEMPLITQACNFQELCPSLSRFFCRSQQRVESMEQSPRSLPSVERSERKDPSRRLETRVLLPCTEEVAEAPGPEATENIEYHLPFSPDA
tara:strand:- start:406 stop:732 length:327 start_codon:yes stop_codon:yes gene_type:complete